MNVCKTVSVKVKGSNMTLSQRALSQTAINVSAFCFQCKMKYGYAFSILSDLFFLCLCCVHNVLALLASVANCSKSLKEQTSLNSLKLLSLHSVVH